MTEVILGELLEESWNPVRGCTRISPGCKNCYAATFAERFRGVAGHPYEQGFDLRLVPERLSQPLRWRRSRRVGVNSMSDLFHEGVPDAFLEAVAWVMQLARWHFYGILTRRSERMRDLLQTRLRAAAEEPHIWWGVSVEDRKHGLPRIEHLRASGARFCFLCLEPLLEDLGPLNLDGIGWVMVGGETGPHARPLAEEWVLAIRDQCQRAAIPFFFKHWGGPRPRQRGCELEGRTHREVPRHPGGLVLTDQERHAALAALEAHLALEYPVAGTQLKGAKHGDQQGG